MLTQTIGQSLYVYIMCIANERLVYIWVKTEKWILSYQYGIADNPLFLYQLMWVSPNLTVLQQPTTHINMYNKNCMYHFVNCMYCKFPRINDSWFLIPDIQSTRWIQRYIYIYVIYISEMNTRLCGLRLVGCMVFRYWYMYFSIFSAKQTNNHLN